MDPGTALDTDKIVPVGLEMTCRLMPWVLWFAGVVGPVGLDTADRDDVPSRTTYGSVALPSSGAWSSLGDH